MAVNLSRMSTIYALAVILATVKSPFVSSPPAEPPRVERPEVKQSPSKPTSKPEWRLGY